MGVWCGCVQSPARLAWECLCSIGKDPPHPPTSICYSPPPTSLLIQGRRWGGGLLWSMKEKSLALSTLESNSLLSALGRMLRESVIGILLTKNNSPRKKKDGKNRQLIKLIFPCIVFVLVDHVPYFLSVAGGYISSMILWFRFCHRSLWGEGPLN